MECKVIKPFVQFTGPNGFQGHTTNDMVEIEDPEEAQRMAEAGIVEIVGESKSKKPAAVKTTENPVEGTAEASKVETADAPPVAAETAVKSAPRKKGT